MPHVFVTGDTHGDLQIGRLASKPWPEGKHLTKEDYVIVAGDFGLLWKDQPDDLERYWINWLNEKSWTTLFVDGNHENHIRLQQLPIEEKFGGKIGVVSPSLYHLRRGEVYTINGKTFFCFGGALSIDKHLRILNKSYWEAEIPSSKEMEYANENLEKCQNHVDYIVTHTIPEELLPIIRFSREPIDPTRRFLSFIANKVQFERWFCGHLHMDKDMSKFTLLWDRIIQIF